MTLSFLLQIIYIYLGIDSVITIKGVEKGSGLGDINNDGYNDFLIGNTNYINQSGIMVGKVCGYYGNFDLDTIPDFSMEGETKWGQYSRYLCIAGDINDDGYDEVMVGAPNFPDHTNPLGKVYIYSYKNFNSINENLVKNNITTFKLYKNYPNPFNTTTKITYELNTPGFVSLIIYDLLGQEIVRIIDNKFYGSGEYDFAWEGRDSHGRVVGSGVYIYTLNAGAFKKSSKMILIK